MSNFILGFLIATFIFLLIATPIIRHHYYRSLKRQRDFLETIGVLVDILEEVIGS